MSRGSIKNIIRWSIELKLNEFVNDVLINLDSFSTFEFT